MSEDTAFEVGRLYPPIKAIADTLTASQKDLFVGLPGLMGYYPGGIRNQSGNQTDHSGNAYTLLQQGTCPVGYDGNAFVHLGDGTNYLHASAVFPVTGLETWVSSSVRGLTIGGWFMIDLSPGVYKGLISKYGPVTDYGYALVWQSDDKPNFSISGNGSAVVTATALVKAVSVWHFIVGRFSPSTEVAIFVDADKAVNTAAVPSSLNVSTEDFEVGRYLGNDSNIPHAKARDLFICASALSDELIEQIRVASTP